MKLADAENLLKALKQNGPITERWTVFTDEGIVFEALPMGYALGSTTLCTPWTCIPKFQYSALWAGCGMPRNVIPPKMAAHFLWSQELYVYRRERRSALTRAMEELDKFQPLPRFAHHSPYDPLPMPEDFHFMVPGVSWTEIGGQDLCEEEYRMVRQGFMDLLEQFFVSS